VKTIKSHQTPIYVGESYKELDSYLPSNTSGVFFLVDENVFQTRQKEFEGREVIIVPSGEQQKSLNYVEELIGVLLLRGADRSSYLIGVGGGVVCDITGFVATVFMRGIKFAFVPTTLLAQVDASIGGKNGVNTGDYKNMIGAFSQPEFILVDPSFLLTLPKKELISGMAEVVKHACIKSEMYFNYIEENIASILTLNMEVIEELIIQSVMIKAAVVEEDEKESGIRKILNYGHTFGHAIEKKNQLAHGEAVSLGMVIVNSIAAKKGMLDAVSETRINDVLKKIGLPVNISEYDLVSLHSLVKNDKKKAGETISLILLNQIGNAQVVTVFIDDIPSVIS
jgi:3-dehydroquinate synthase